MVGPKYAEIEVTQALGGGQLIDLRQYQACNVSAPNTPTVLRRGGGEGVKVGVKPQTHLAEVPHQVDVKGA